MQYDLSQPEVAMPLSMPTPPFGHPDVSRWASPCRCRKSTVVSTTSPTSNRSVASFRCRRPASQQLAERHNNDIHVAWGQAEFPSVGALSSGNSAEARAPLFAAFKGRMAPSDFFKPFIIGFGFLHSPCGPATTAGAVQRPPRVPTEGVRTCMGSRDTAELADISPIISMPAMLPSGLCENLGTPDSFFGAQ